MTSLLICMQRLVEYKCLVRLWRDPSPRWRTGALQHTNNKVHFLFCHLSGARWQQSALDILPPNDSWGILRCSQAKGVILSLSSPCFCHQAKDSMQLFTLVVFQGLLGLSVLLSSSVLSFFSKTYQRYKKRQEEGLFKFHIFVKPLKINVKVHTLLIFLWWCIKAKSQKLCHCPLWNS